MIANAKALVQDQYPEYQEATLILCHYDKNGYNDKCNYIRL